MNASTPRYHIRLAPIVYAALLFIASGNVLFFIGWYEPLVALLASALTLGSIVFLMARISPKLDEHTLHLSRRDIVFFALAALLLFLYVASSSVMGYFPTDMDHAIMRQALYLNLIDAPWPVVLPNGKEFTYYIANMLPPAIIARYFDEGARQIILVLYIYSMFLIVYILACFYVKKVSLLLLLLLCCFADPIQQIFIRVYLFLIANNFPSLVEVGNQFIAQISFIEFTALGNSIAPYNSSLVTLMAAAVIIMIKESRHITIPLCIALIFPSSPIGALALMPIALFYYLPILKNKKKLLTCAISLIVPVLLVLLTAIYYFRASNPITYIRFAWQVMESADFFTFLVRQLAATAFFVLPLILCRSIGNIKYLFLLPLVTSMIYYGFIVPKDYTLIINEFYFKGVLTYNFIIALYWVKHWGDFKYYKYLILGCGLFALALLCRERYRTFSPDMPVYDCWNGHLNHDDPFFERAWPPLKETSLLSEIIMDESGESEKRFPGLLLPKAPGCDYSRPKADPPPKK